MLLSLVQANAPFPTFTTNGGKLYESVFILGNDINPFLIRLPRNLDYVGYEVGLIACKPIASTNNFGVTQIFTPNYENSNATATNIGTISNLENINHFSMEQAVKLFEELLKIEREKYNKENSKDDK